MSNTNTFKRKLGISGYLGTASDLKFAIGKNFAVKKDGTIYALGGANIAGVKFSENISSG
jgi:hypothetical protein